MPRKPLNEAQREAHRAAAKRYRASHKEQLKGEARTYYRENREKVLAARERRGAPQLKRNWNLLQAYGITLEDYERMYAEQKGICPLCGKWFPSGGRAGLHVDHNRETGQVRNLLCSPCNRLLGHVEHPPVGEQKYHEYLKRHADKAVENKGET